MQNKMTKPLEQLGDLQCPGNLVDHEGRRFCFVDGFSCQEETRTHCSKYLSIRQGYDTRFLPFSQASRIEESDGYD